MKLTGQLPDARRPDSIVGMTHERLASLCHNTLSSRLSPPFPRSLARAEHQNFAPKKMDKLREALQRFAGAVGPIAGSAAARAAGVGAVGLAGVAYGGSSCLFNVEGGHRAVMFHRFGGVQQRVRAEGTHLIVPWFMRVRAGDGSFL